MPDPRVQTLLDELSPRAGPLIVTLFGDSIAPRGGEIRLSSLIALAAPLGISERAVRTAVYRLRRAGWLAAQASGRNSNYSLTQTGRVECEQAEQRIYSSAPTDWDGGWLLVQALSGLTPAARQGLRKKLGWLGFGQLSPTLSISPNTGHELQSLLQLPQFSGKLSVFRATRPEIAGAASAIEIAGSAWDLGSLSHAYSALKARFEGCAAKPPDDPLSCFVLRSLLVHEYRRVLLKDPQLPSDLLPSDWTGTDARRLTRRLYRSLCSRADVFVDEHCSGSAEPTSGEGNAYKQRFA